MGTMKIMDGSGDSKLIWDSRNRDEVDAAKKMFKDLKAKGYTAFNVTKDGDKDGKIAEFDESLEKIIMVPRISGG